MLNFYSCGCTAIGDVPILSRCGLHGGHVVALVKDQVNQIRSFRSGDIRIKHKPLPAVIADCRSKNIAFDLIAAYPEHASFYAHDSLVEKGWRRKINPLIGDLHSLLTDDGHMLLIIEQTLLARALYDCFMSGFELNSVTLVSSVIAHEPYHKLWPEFYVYKFALLFSKHGEGLQLPEYVPMSKLHKHLEPLRPKKLLELSCIHPPFLHLADKTLGVCENYSRYVKLKAQLCES